MELNDFYHLVSPRYECLSLPIAVHMFVVQASCAALLPLRPL